MSFAWPIALSGLALVALALIAYLVAQRRRRRYVVRFTNLDLLENVVADSPRWRRHIPAVLTLLGLSALVVGGWRHHDVGLVRERDDADAEAVGEPVDERARGLPRSRHPVGRDIRRSHRARAVHRQDHGRLLARHGDRDLRPGHADHECTERQQRERRRNVAPPAG